MSSRRSDAANLYYLQGLAPGAAVSSVANACCVQIWNPSSIITLRLIELATVRQTGASAGTERVVGKRTIARGSPGASVASSAEHHARRERASRSGFTMDLAQFGAGAEPTLAGGSMIPCWGPTGETADGFFWPFPHGIEIPPGTGFAVVRANGATSSFGQSEWAAIVEEV